MPYRGISLAFMLMLCTASQAADPGGQWQNSPHQEWFNGLTSEHGLCCSFADGISITDADWEVSKEGYRVRLQGEWVDVPPEALVKGANRIGSAVVWPYPYPNRDGKTTVRCFMPGAMT